MKKFWTMTIILFWAVSLSALPALAGDYPDHEITFVVGFSPGGSTDTTIRTVATPAAEILKQPVVVTNKPGAGGSLALAAVLKAQPDGYTLVNFNISAPMGNAIRGTEDFNSAKDFTHICNLTSFPNIIVTPVNSEFKTLKDLVEKAKANPGVLTGATSGVGTSQHFGLELFKSQAGIDITHVPHKGSTPAVAALLGGHIDCGNINSVDVIQHIKAGKLRGLAVTSPERIPELPDLPTISEAGYPGAVIISWIGCAGPKNMPDALVQKLASTFEKVLNDSEVKAKLKSIGFNAAYMPPEEFTKFVQKEFDRYMDLAKKAGINK